MYTFFGSFLLERSRTFIVYLFDDKSCAQPSTSIFVMENVCISKFEDRLKFHSRYSRCSRNCSYVGDRRCESAPARSLQVLVFVFISCYTYHLQVLQCVVYKDSLNASQAPVNNTRLSTLMEKGGNFYFMQNVFYKKLISIINSMIAISIL